MKVPRIDTLHQQQISDELQDIQRRPLELVIEPEAALELAGILRAALQQPILTTSQIETAKGLVEAIQGYFHDAPAVREMLELIAGSGCPEARAADTISIDDMGLNLRTLVVLRNAGVNTLSDLLKKSISDVMAFPGFNRRALNELNRYLSTAGLALRGC